MQRLEYTVVTRADRELAWKVFSDWRLWRRFSDIYGNIQWLKGEPWMPGSRLKIEVVTPVRTVVDHVITVCSPAESVAWIDHALCYSMEQWVTFHPLVGGGTRVHTWIDIVGSAPDVSGCDVRDFLGGFTRKWYDSFGVTCDQLAEENALLV
ncbi:MAG TPA: hypothetical protein VJ723_13420 [Candidatus Angelobacter sp.]|nr:hypothetical protein [Candidatus Angelobacter sp.]